MNIAILLFTIVVRVIEVLCLLFGLAALINVPFSQMQDKQRRERGWWAEYLSVNQLRANEIDDIAVVYHELDKWHFFYGKLKQHPALDEIRVPGQDAWNAKVPFWMNDRREEILQRMDRELNPPKKRRRVEFVDDNRSR